jgi:hypothetical protein
LSGRNPVMERVVEHGDHDVALEDEHLTDRVDVALVDSLDAGVVALLPAANVFTNRPVPERGSHVIDHRDIQQDEVGVVCVVAVVEAVDGRTLVRVVLGGELSTVAECLARRVGVDETADVSGLVPVAVHVDVGPLGLRCGRVVGVAGREAQRSQGDWYENAKISHYGSFSSVHLIGNEHVSRKCHYKKSPPGDVLN